MSRHARSGSLVMATAIMVLVTLAVVGSGVITRAAAPERPAVAPADTSLDSPASPAAKGFHGYCRCSCSFIPNCNTSADCGGGVCGHSISCC